MRRRQPVELGRLTVLAADPQGGAAVYELQGSDQTRAEAAAVKLTIGLLLELTANLRYDPAAESFVQMIGWLTETSLTGGWHEVDVLGPYQALDSMTIKGPQKIFAGMLEIHRDDTQSVRWAMNTPLETGKFADLAARLAINQLAPSLSSIGGLLLSRSMLTMMDLMSQGVDMLQDGVRDFSAHAAVSVALNHLAD